MTVKDLLEKYKDDFEVVTENIKLDKKIENVYIGDLLSWVMGNAEENSAWITIHGHINIVAVALLINVSCIIVAENANVTKETIDKAIDENIIVLKTIKTHYEVAKLFYKEGL